jgi:phage gp36-like protein
LIDQYLAPIPASLSDTFNVIDKYASVEAPLSDAVKIMDTYALPIQTSLSDALGVVDSYLSPVTAPLTDIVSVGDHLTVSSGIIGPAGVAGLAVFGGVLVVRRQRKRKS